MDQERTPSPGGHVQATYMAGAYTGVGTTEETSDGLARREHTHMHPGRPCSLPTIEPPTELQDPESRVLWDAECAVRQAEANRVVVLLQYIASTKEGPRSEGRQAYEQLQLREASPVQLRLCTESTQDAVDLAERAALMYAADALKCSEHYVRGLQLAAERGRTQLPRVWRAFRSGRISALALHKITSVLDKQLLDSTIEKIDTRAPDVAERRRPGQLADWLRRITATTEPGEAAERFTRAAKNRYVAVKDVEDGMSLLTAVMPSLTAHSIKQKLEAAARSAHQAVPHNPLIAHQIQQQEQRF